MKQRVLRGAAALIASAVLTLGMASTASASTAPTGTAATSAVQIGTGPNVTPLSSSGCNVNVCIGISNVSNSTVTIQGWAYSHDFYGYLKFTGPTGLNKVAGPKTWLGGHGNYAYIVNPATIGQYCVHGYFPDGTSQGTACSYLN